MCVQIAVNRHAVHIGITELLESLCLTQIPKLAPLLVFAGLFKPMLFKHVLRAKSSFWGSQPPVGLLASHFTLTSDPLLAAAGNGCVNLAEAQGGVEQTWGWELPVGSGCAQVAASYLPTLHRLPACRSLYGSVLPCPALYPLPYWIYPLSWSAFKMPFLFSIYPAGLHCHKQTLFLLYSWGFQ